MKRIIINIIQYTLFISLGLFLLYLAFRGKNIHEIERYLITANYYWVFLSLAIGYAAFYIRSYRWNLLIESIGYQPKLMNTYHAVIIGYTANFALPRIGEVVRCGTLNRIEKVPADILIGTVIAERAFDLLCLLLLTFLTILLKFKFFGTFFKEKIFDYTSQRITSTFNFSLFIWLSLIVFAIVILALFYIFRQRIKKIALVQKISSIGKGVLKGIYTVLQLKRKKAFLFHTLILWTLYYAMTYVILFSLSSTSKLTPVDGLFVFVIGSFGMAAPVQGGMGAFHTIVSLGLTGLYLIPQDEAIAFAVISHEPQVIGIVIAGAISMLILFLRRKKINKTNTI